MAIITITFIVDIMVQFQFSALAKASFTDEDDLTAQALYRLGHADTAGDILAALHDFHAPQQNVVFADRAGEIGFVAAGLVPKRRALYAGSQMPAPGWSGPSAIGTGGLGVGFQADVQVSEYVIILNTQEAVN